MWTVRQQRQSKLGKKKYIYGAHKGELEALSVSYWVLCHGAKHTLGPGGDKVSGWDLVGTEGTVSLMLSWG